MDFLERPEFPNHPGSLAAPCELQTVIRRNPYGSSMNGYGCSFTGGHCLPGTDCADKQTRHAELERQERLYEKTLHEGRVIFKA